MAEVQDYLKSVDFWNADSSGKRIAREYTLKNFMSVVRLINQIAEIAETENHHPDLHLTSYRKLRIELTTHALNGLTENDFILAAKINQLMIETKV